jgi:hypothetical protein
MPEGYSFDERTARRIVEAVKIIENQYGNNLPNLPSRGIARAERWLFGVTTAAGTGTPAKHPWKEIRPAAAGFGAWEDWPAGEGGVVGNVSVTPMQNPLYMPDGSALADATRFICRLGKRREESGQVVQEWIVVGGTGGGISVEETIACNGSGPADLFSVSKLRFQKEPFDLVDQDNGVILASLTGFTGTRRIIYDATKVAGSSGGLKFWYRDLRFCKGVYMDHVDGDFLVAWTSQQVTDPACLTKTLRFIGEVV